MAEISQSVIDAALVEPAEVEDAEPETVTESSGSNGNDSGDSDYELVNPDEYFTGVVTQWNCTWGFLENDETKQSIFVHVTSVNSKDHHTFLRKGMHLKYQQAKRISSGKICAVQVTAIDGSPLSFFEKQGETDRYSRKLVEPDAMFTGVVKNYFFKRRFGWITPDANEDANAMQQSFLKKDIYVGREDILTRDFPPGLRVGTKVQFQLYEDERGVGACNVKGSDGELIAANTIRKDYSGMTFTGVVVKFRLHGYVFIKPDDNLKEFGVWGDDVHGLCEEIQTKQRPARVSEQAKVTFKLMKDENGFHAIDIRDEEGQAIVCEEDPHFGEDKPREREIVSEDDFEGSVKSFSWSKGTGWIKADLPQPLASRSSREGFVYFYRKDLVSEDKVYGVLENKPVKFKLYQDEKGLGAYHITDENGEALRDQERPKEAPQPQHGSVNFYDRQKKVLHIRFKGRTHAVPKKHCLILRSAEKYLHKGLKVEFMVERYRGRNFLKQVSFPGRRAEPRKAEKTVPGGPNPGASPFASSAGSESQNMPWYPSQNLTHYNYFPGPMQQNFFQPGGYGQPSSRNDMRFNGPPRQNERFGPGPPSGGYNSPMSFSNGHPSSRGNGFHY